MVARLLALLLIIACEGALADVSPDLQRQIRTSTFEVVMKKPTGDSVRYEKPLPLDLLPFIERTDLYRSLGTAFTLGPNTYVTAAHVLIACIDSQYGAPALRATDGTVHPIASIQAFSAAEDFVVFSLADPLDGAALPTNRTPRVDDVVMAVGNALGDGVVIRDGLFTSETAEEQDGRWKWIRFSAAASPGNSGGPLLDASGKIIGVVVAKSPNENLNYALPIANVLDAPKLKARFDQRALTKLPFAEGSQTYSLKDEFVLPLSWDRFVRAYQEVIARHNDRARQALLTSQAAVLFPHGNDSEDILYSSEPAARNPGLVMQQPDGKWVVEAPSLQFTDLPGDGKIGVAAAAGGGVMALHRGDEASDDTFYSDSKSFMDIALKALNLRRAVGTDQVRVVSLGAAMSDAMTTDTSGRRWQVRVWPVPFLDMYLVVQLLPTPDGYIGLLLYTPSAGLREAKAQLSLLANQATLTYVGTTKQWQSFLARTALLPDSLKEVKLQSAPQWNLHTRRFDFGVPPDVMAIDSHSLLLLSMNYAYDGPQVAWGIGGAWWYHDAQQKNSVSLWRAAKPPGTVKLETRTRFADLQAHNSPYDGSPVQATSDSVEVQLGIQAPGVKEGMASSGVVYALALQINGHPSRLQAAQTQSSEVKAVHILERGIGPDAALVATPSAANPLDSVLQAGQRLADAMDAKGKDLRGRLYSDDYNQFMVPLLKTGGSGMTEAGFTDLSRSLTDYWNIAPHLVSNRDLWSSFLLKNHLPADTPHSAAVLTAESALQDLILKGGPPTADWTYRTRDLTSLYISERKTMIHKPPAGAAALAVYNSRTSTCPAPTDHTSGHSKPRLADNPHSLQEYYPPDLIRHAVEGTVVLSLKIDAGGCATALAVTGSSGADAFDDAALKWAETETYLPAEQDGKPVAESMPLMVNFKLE
jgi:serine protease Do